MRLARKNVAKVGLMGQEPASVRRRQLQQALEAMEAMEAGFQASVVTRLPPRT
jgi:hypothetical protein